MRDNLEITARLSQPPRGVCPESRHIPIDMLAHAYLDGEWKSFRHLGGFLWPTRLSALDVRLTLT